MRTYLTQVLLDPDGPDEGEARKQMMKDINAERFCNREGLTKKEFLLLIGVVICLVAFWSGVGWVASLFLV